MNNVCKFTALTLAHNKATLEFSCSLDCDQSGYLNRSTAVYQRLVNRKTLTTRLQQRGPSLKIRNIKKRATVSRRREHVPRLPPRAAELSTEIAPGANSPPFIQYMTEAITAAAIAAVDRHLACMGLYPRFEPVSSHDFVTNIRPLVASASIATPAQSRIYVGLSR